MAENQQLPEPFNVHAWLVEPSGIGAGVTHTQQQKLDVLEAEWDWREQGGSGRGTIKVSGDLLDPNTYITEAWEIILDIRLEKEVAYARWYRGVILDIKAKSIGGKTVSTIYCGGYWDTQATKQWVDNDYTTGTQDVQAITQNIVDSQGVDSNTRIVYDATKVAASTYTPATFDAVGSASRVIRALAEVQGSRTYNIDPDNRKFQFLATSTTVAERNIYIVGKDVHEVDFGNSHTRGVNNFQLIGRNNAGGTNLIERGNAADITSYGKKTRSVILPYLSLTADLQRWADNKISDFKAAQQYGVFTIPDVQARVESVTASTGNIRLYRKKTDGTSEFVNLPLQKVRYKFGLACEADYEVPDCTPEEIRPKGRTIQAMVWIGNPVPDLPEWNELLELEKEHITVWIGQGRGPDPQAGDPNSTLPPASRTFDGQLTSDTTNNDVYMYDSAASNWKRIGGQNLAFKDEANAFTQENSFGSQKLTSVADPTAAQDVATKAYVDAVAIGIDWKPSVRVATTANITLSGTQTIDGVAVIADDRVLVKDQTAGAENGLYLVAAGAWTRTTDANTSAEVTAGVAVFISEGTANGNRGWILTTNDPITLGTTALVFTQFLGPGADDHGQLTGLADDDHAQYLRTDGTRASTGIQDFDASVRIRAAGAGNYATLARGDDVTKTITLPSATSTLPGLSLTNTFTAAQEISLSVPLLTFISPLTTAKTRVGKAIDQERTDLCTNLSLSGGVWNLDDTAIDGTIYQQFAGTHRFRRASAGVNPRTLSNYLTIEADGDFMVAGDTIKIGDQLGSLYQLGVLVAATAAELNIMDGVTATTAELNIMDGVTLTAAQINKAAIKDEANTFTAAQTISANADTLPAPPAGTIIHMGGANAANPSMTLDAFGSNPVGFVGRRSGGTAAVPSAVTTDDTIAQFQGRGYGATGYSSGLRASMSFFASEPWTDAAQGTYVLFYTTPNGGVSGVERIRIGNDGKVGIGGITADELLDVNGNIRFKGGAATYDVTLTHAAAVSNKTLTLPDVTGTLVALNLAQTFTAVQTFNENITMAALKTVDGRDISVDGVIIDDAARKSVANTFTANQTISKVDPQLIIVNTDTGGDSWQLEVGSNADTPAGAFKINETGVADRLVIDALALGARATSVGWIFGDAAGTPAAELHIKAESPAIRFDTTLATDDYEIEGGSSLIFRNITDARTDIKIGDTGILTLGDVGGEDELTITPGTGATVSNDINAAGGFRNHCNFLQINVAANQSVVGLYRDTANNFWGYPMVRGGSITGIAVGVNSTADARTSGTLTVEAYVYSMTLGGAATATGLQAILDGTNTKFKATTQAKDVDTFSAGQAILCYITTSVDWAPTTADIYVTIEYEA